MQITAGFVGLGAGQGLAALLDRVLGVKLDKGERYTDWSKRPLSAAQLEYGAGDVIHLLDLADELARRAEELGRTEWVAEEHARRYGPDARILPDPDNAWRKVKGGGRLQRAATAPCSPRSPRGASARRQRRDKPASWIIPDRTLVEIAHRRPGQPAGARERARPARPHPRRRRRRRCSRRSARARPPSRSTVPPPPSPELQQRLEVLGPLGAVLVTARAAGVDLAPSLLATRDEIGAFLVAAVRGDDLSGMQLGTGWRRELAGEALIDLAEGRLSLGVDPRRPYLAEIPRPAHPRTTRGHDARPDPLRAHRLLHRRVGGGPRGPRARGGAARPERRRA